MEKIAIIIPGGFGNKDMRRNIPALSSLIQGLSETFDITIYSLSRIEPAEGSAFKLRSVNTGHSSNLIWRLTVFIFLFFRDHLSNRFRIIHGIWAVPAGLMAVILSRLFNIHSVVTLNGGESACISHISYGNMFHSRLKKLTLFTCRRAHELAALTRYQYNNLKRFGLRRDNVHIIPYGTDRTMFKFRNKGVRIPVNCIHIANLTPIKDQKTLLMTVARLKKSIDCRLRIIGEDYMDGKIHELVKELNLSDTVEFLGYVPYSDLSRYYDWAHIMLHTSLYEGQAVVLAEAAAKGVVICGTESGLIADMGQECTISCAPGAYEDLAIKVLGMIKNPEVYFRLQTNSLRWATSHDIKWTAEKYSDLYKSIL